jgi:hypothetical protein
VLADALGRFVPYKPCFFLSGSHFLMTRVLTRTNFNSSNLIRTLTDLSMLEAVEPGTAFAEKMSQWVDFKDAINLCAVHNAGDSNPTDYDAGPQQGTALAATEIFENTRTAAVNFILASCSTNTLRSRIKLPVPEPETYLEEAGAYEAYRRFHLAHQREMESTVRPLRATVRGLLTTTSPRLSQLAALDAALDGILCDRESTLLSTVPKLLAKRFALLRKTHQQDLATSQRPDRPEMWMKPGGWLAQFCGELQAVLLAELDVRLQPTLGLIEALTNDHALNV